MKKNRSTKSTGLPGNTYTGKPDEKKHHNWFFTWNNYTSTDFNIFKTYCESDFVKEYAFQIEEGEKGTKHIQGCIRFKYGRKFSTVKNELGKKIHIEIAKKWDESVKYCTKSDTRIEGPFTNIDLPQEIKDVLNTKKMHLWQEKIMEIISEEPDDRSIYWFYDEKGCSGKTTLARHICLKYPNRSLYLSGKASDMKYAVTEFINNHNLMNCIFDFTRTNENYISYEGLEAIKNGIVFNSKYEAKMAIFNPPHIICFANYLPDIDKLSHDRWQIYNIVDNGGYKKIKAHSD